MKKCKDCKYFKRNTDEFHLKTFGECKNEDKIVYGDTRDDVAYRTNVYENDMLVYRDYEWYSAQVEVGEEFGCIHFEKKEV